jgi:large subunit ribosomal protein L24
MAQGLHVKKGDTVIVLSGKDRGKRGKVLRVVPAKHQVYVEGIHKQKRHQKPNPKVMQGGIISREGPIHSSNVMVYCLKCHRPTQVRWRQLESGQRARVCKACGEQLDR